MRLLDVRGGKQRVGDGFIHAHSGSQCAAADIRDAAELKETLNGAVFAVFAVQHGEEDIDLQNGIVAVCVQNDKTVRRFIGRDERGARGFAVHPRVVFNVFHSTRIEQPATVLCDAEGENVKFLCIEISDDRSGGHQRNFIFRRRTAEDHANCFFHDKGLLPAQKITAQTLF